MEIVSVLSAYLYMHNEHFCNKLYKSLHTSLDLLNEAQAKKVDLSEASVKQLTDMGFPENRARKALLMNQYVFLYPIT